MKLALVRDDGTVRIIANLQGYDWKKSVARAALMLDLQEALEEEERDLADGAEARA